MRFSYAESMTDPDFYPPLARAAEEAGYSSMVIPDSICYPLESETTYPFNPDGSRQFLEDKPFLEPFSLIPALGAITTSLRFVTFVLKLPIRHPVLVAKQAGSVAVLTNNRLALGVGTSPWPEDYTLLDVPWAGRGLRMDEELAVIRGLTSGGYFEFHGEVFDFPAVKMSPAPSEPIP
ncbi:MAG TPA: LLM class flavin-dependent oxidoreductase, partial [Acidimicrobiales bacterium]|nr:LLM class flavin-dependent oxidoreductase [Acidimicrobiales bacterium]